MRGMERGGERWREVRENKGVRTRDGEEEVKLNVTLFSISEEGKLKAEEITMSVPSCVFVCVEMCVCMCVCAIHKLPTGAIIG